MKRHILVFDEGSDPEVELRAFVDSLDAGAEMYVLDGHACFIKSALSTSEVSRRFQSFAGSRLYFVANVTSSDCAGRMVGKFWDFIKRAELQTAAE